MNNPNDHPLIDLTFNQKMSVINLLFIVASCDGGDHNWQEKEINYLNNHISTFGVRKDNCLTYFKKEEHQGMVNDLKILSQYHKKFLYIAVLGMVNSGIKADERKEYYITRFLEAIGIEPDILEDI